MPVSVVFETASNVNAALRESLGGSCSTVGAKTAAGVTASGDALIKSCSGYNDVDSLQEKLVASAKRVLLSKIDYEEVSNYNHSVLDSLKSKYIVLTSDPSSANVNGGADNCGAASRASPATNKIMNGYSSSAAETNGYDDEKSGKNVAVNGHNGHNGHADNGSGMNGNINNNYSNGNGVNNNNVMGNNLKRTNLSGNMNSCNGNANELPLPKRVLFPRENVRIGWKNPTQKWRVGAGLQNVGNTCYLNSTLQALFHVPSLANWLVSEKAHMERCDGGGDTGCMICAMAKTLLETQMKSSPVRPYYIYNKLRYICKSMVMGRQEDAHEFMRYLVEAMEKSYLARYRNYRELDQYSKETTPLNQILGGYLKTAVHCLACSHVSVTYQHFQDLLLDIRKATTVEDALETHFSRERLEDMGYKCESCKKKVSATKQFSLERAPITLCLQLKRFSVVGTKLTKDIAVKTRLDLTKYLSRKTPGESLTYKLVAMVTHLGATQHCGHYTAIGLTESGMFFNYDDSSVRPITVHNVCNTNAYIIFYEMENAPSRHIVGIPHSVSEAKEGGQKNGQALVARRTSSPVQRLIGPQLPPGGFSSYTTAPSPLNNANTPLTNGNGAKGTLGADGNHSKITIHFKTTMAGAAAGNQVSSSINGVCVSSGGGGNENDYDRSSNGHTSKHIQMQNGLLLGTGKFQESAYTQPPLASQSDQKQAAPVPNGRTSPYYSEPENEVSSSSAVAAPLSAPSDASSIPLPNMPQLGENSELYESSSAPQAQSQPRPNSCAMPISLKSLVPYESETDEDDVSASAAADVKRVKCNEKAEQPYRRNPLKRRNSSSAAFVVTNADDDLLSRGRVNSPVSSTNGAKMKRLDAVLVNGNGNRYANVDAFCSNVQSKAKQQKTDAIDVIFNSGVRRNARNNTIANGGGGNKSSNNHTRTGIRESRVADEAPSDDDNDDEESEGVQQLSATGSDDENQADLPGDEKRVPFKRSHSTPPSPTVVKTTAGLWKVSPLQSPADASVSTNESRSSKNLRNPFAIKVADGTGTSSGAVNASLPIAKRIGAIGQQKRSATSSALGYQAQQQAADCEPAVEALLTNSHRGYGAPVLTWHGTQSQVERDIITDARVQRQRDWDEEVENDMDRGRQKKISSAAKEPQAANRTPGYNPFQEQQENQNRWKRNGPSHGHGGHNGPARHNFEGHRFNKFSRCNKFQRFSGNNGNNSASQKNAGSFNRRDS